MSRFEIVEIGAAIEPTAGIPEGCELCGHCLVLRSTLGEGAALPCGAASGLAGRLHPVDRAPGDPDPIRPHDVRPGTRPTPTL